MDIDYALIADYAEITGGKLYVMGGGWDTTYAPEEPALVRMGLAVGVRVSWNEAGKDIPVHMTIEDDDGQVLVNIDGGVTVSRVEGQVPGSGQLAQVAANVAFSAPRRGGYRVLVRAGTGEETVSRSLPFRVVPPPGA